MGAVISAFESYETTPGLLDRETGKPVTEPVRWGAARYRCGVVWCGVIWCRIEKTVA